MKEEYSIFTRGPDKLQITLLPSEKGDETIGVILVHCNGELQSHGIYDGADAQGAYNRLVIHAQSQGWQWLSALTMVNSEKPKPAFAALFRD